MVDQIIQCGIKAPSAMNQQPWHFTVIKNRELLDQMDADAPKPQMPSKGDQPGGFNLKPGQSAGSKRHLFIKAPLVALISVTENSKFSTFDAVLACENISLSVQGMGLGTHIIAAMQVLFEGPKSDEYRKLLRISDEDLCRARDWLVEKAA
jgi:nitroreductase